MNEELYLLSLKIQFLNTLSEDELDKAMFFFANVSGNSESGADEDVLAECEAYGVSWEEIVFFMKHIRKREADFFKLVRTPDYSIFAVVSFFSAQLQAGQEIFSELASLLHSKCGISRDVVMLLSVAREALFVNKKFNVLNDICAVHG